MNWSALSTYLLEKHELEVHIETATPVGGGDIHQAFHLKTPFELLFLKVNDASLAPLFATEFHSLEQLVNTGVLEVPKPIATGIVNDKAFLLMSFLEISHQGDDFQRGKDLALLHHQIHNQSKFGWFEDNYIGRTLQTNTWSDNWVEFYREARLLPQLTLAEKNGASAELIECGQQLINKLPTFFEHYSPKASLLHGDLWGGNSAFLPTGDSVFFDPACYYGDRECDLAMTELFGGFSPLFYEGYDLIFPRDAGYSDRKPLYQLYHQLNHFNLFGGHYHQQSLQTLKHLL